MTEKRFSIDKSAGLYRIYDNGKLVPIIDGQPICDLLNKLHDENNKLKNEINMLRVTIARNESYIKKITETSEWGKF